jgi:hypothetical protein
VEQQVQERQPALRQQVRAQQLPVLELAQEWQRVLQPALRRGRQQVREPVGELMPKVRRHRC